jgi:hypothetical protein
MYAPTREQARRFLFDVWRKYRAGGPLSGLEPVALEVILMHPEYQGLLADSERHIERDYAPQDGSINPFLHLNLHLAIEEQLSIDQPVGIRAECQRLVAALGSEHDAKHAILECLGEVLWQAQRNAGAPDEAQYLECLRRRGARR